MTTAVLKASSTVLDFIHAEGGIVTFVVKDREPDDSHIRRHEISREMWNDLGKPDQITLTIQPGDVLNEPGETENHHATSEEAENA